MSNRQACSYVKVAIYNISKNYKKLTYENILEEMNWLFDIYTEEGIEEKAESLY